MVGPAPLHPKNTMLQDEFMDADVTVSEVNDRFEDAVGFRFHEDVRATIIFEQLVKEHRRAKVLRALTGSWRNFQIRSKPRLLSTNSRLTLIVIRSEFSRPAGSFHSAIKPPSTEGPH